MPSMPCICVNGCQELLKSKLLDSSYHPAPQLLRVKAFKRDKK